MLKFEYTVKGPLGWCARAANTIVQSVISTKSTCRYRIISRPPNYRYPLREGNLKSIMDILMGVASTDTVVEISIDGPDEVEVVEAVKKAIIEAESVR